MKKKNRTKGDLFNQVVRLSGVPADKIGRELKRVLNRKNIDPKDLTLEQLRRTAASYLREIMTGLLERQNHRK